MTSAEPSTSISASLGIVLFSSLPAGLWSYCNHSTDLLSVSVTYQST